jgi:hypothetical protein
VDEEEVTLSVPAGSYVINGSMGVSSEDADDFANIPCFLSNTNIASGDIGEAELTMGPVSNGHVEYRQATVQAAFSVGAAGGVITSTVKSSKETRNRPSEGHRSTRSKSKRCTETEWS